MVTYIFGKKNKYEYTINIIICSLYFEFNFNIRYVFEKLIISNYIDYKVCTKLMNKIIYVFDILFIEHFVIMKHACFGSMVISRRHHSDYIKFVV